MGIDSVCSRSCCCVGALLAFILLLVCFDWAIKKASSKHGAVAIYALEFREYHVWHLSCLSEQIA